MVARPASRSSRAQRFLTDWFETIAPWVGMAGMVVAFALNRPEFAIPFGGLIGLPSIFAAQQRRNGRRGRN